MPEQVPDPSSEEKIVLNPPHPRIVVVSMGFLLLAMGCAWAASHGIFSDLLWMLMLPMLSLGVGLGLAFPMVVLDRRRGYVASMRKLLFVLPIDRQVRSLDSLEAVEVDRVLFTESEAGVVGSRSMRVHGSSYRYPVRLRFGDSSIEVYKHDEVSEALDQARSLAAFTGRPMDTRF